MSKIIDRSPQLMRSLLSLTFLLSSLGSSLGIGFGLSAQPSLAQTPTPTPLPGQPNRPRGEWLQELNLNPDQTRRVQEIRQRSQAQMQQLRRNLRQAREELNQLMDGNASQRQIEEKFSQVQSLQRQVEQLRFENRLAIREVLTPEQRQQLRTIMQARFQERRQRWQGAPRLKNQEF